jgi:hypothetical protein
VARVGLVICEARCGNDDLNDAEEVEFVFVIAIVTSTSQVEVAAARDAVTKAKENGDWLPARGVKRGNTANRFGPGACPPFPWAGLAR